MDEDDTSIELFEVIYKFLNEEGLTKTATTLFSEKQLDKNIDYSQYIAETLDKGIDFTEYIAEHVNKNIEFSDYLAENHREELSKLEICMRNTGGNIWIQKK